MRLNDRPRLSRTSRLCLFREEFQDLVAGFVGQLFWKKMPTLKAAPTYVGRAFTPSRQQVESAARLPPWPFAHLRSPKNEHRARNFSTTICLIML